MIFSLLVLSFFLCTRWFPDIEVGVFALVAAAFILVFCFASIGVAGMAFEWGHYRKTRLQVLKNALKNHIGHVLFFFAFICLTFFCVVFIMPFYFSSNSYIGVFVAVMMFWFFVLFLPSMQYYFPMTLFMPDDGVFLTFKKCLFLAMNNKALTLFVTVKTIVDFVISFLTCFLIPGFAGIAVSHIDVVKLMLLRYDYMRDHAVPMSDVNEFAMLENERACIGPRTIRNIIFPWK